MTQGTHMNTTTWWSAAALCVLASGALACSDDDAPRDAGAQAPPTLADVQARLLTPSCSFDACHGQINPKRDLNLANVDASMASLINVPGDVPGTTRVIPGDPDNSMLLQVLERQVADVRQMPPGFPVEDATLDMVRAWIAAGAPRGEGDGTMTPSLPEAEQPDPNENGPRREELPQPDPSEGFQMGIDTMAPAGEEIWKCWVEDLPGNGFVAIDRVEAIQTPGVHHMDIMALGLLGLPIEPGMHDCDELYRTHAEMMEEGIFLFATQNERETLQLPDGVAALVPGNMTIMVEMHYVNPTNRDVDVWSRVNGYFTDKDAVEDEIWGSAVRDVDINIPPNATGHVEWTRCVMNTDIELVLLSTHTHQLAELAEVFFFDGAETGDLVYVNDDWHAPELKLFDPTIPIPAGTGFEFRCHYNNPTTDTVNWGFDANDEMCQIAIVHTPFDFQAACDIVESGVTLKE